MSVRAKPIASNVPLPNAPDREECARAALEDRFGRSLSDAEWQVYRSRLLAYIVLLRSWEDQAP